MIRPTRFINAFICFILIGKVGIGLNSRWYQSKDNKTENIDAAERAMMFMIGWFANPIFGSGDYPSIMKQKVNSTISFTFFIFAVKKSDF